MGFSSIVGLNIVFINIFIYDSGEFCIWSLCITNFDSFVLLLS